MKKVRLTEAQIRKIIRDELIKEGVIDTVSPAAAIIGKGIGAYLGSPELKAQLKGAQANDQVFDDVLKLTQVGVIRQPLQKLSAELNGHDQQSTAQPRNAQQPQQRPAQTNNQPQHQTMQQPKM